MLVKIEARNPRSSLLSLLMEDANTGFTIQDVGGLSPVKATIVSSGFARLDGTQFHSVRRESRNLTLRLGLEPVYGLYSVEDLRGQLYDFFMPKSQVALRFIMSSGLEVDILGMVETCEPAIFTKDPAVDISIICFDPDFFDRVSVLSSGSSTEDTAETSLDYLGSIESGVKFTLNVDRSLSDFSIYLRLPSGDLRILEFEGTLVSGDVLTISTVPGTKYASLVHLGVTSSVLYGVTTQSDWFQLEKGTNYIRVYAVGAAIPYTLEYTTRYGGL